MRKTPVARKGPFTLSVPPGLADEMRKQRILDGLVDAVATKTFASTTISDIVSRAGVSRATFYKIFKDKQDCFLAAVDDFVEDCREELEETYADLGPDPRPEEISKGIATLLRVLAEKPDHAKVAMIETAAVEPTAMDGHREKIIEAVTAPWKGKMPDRARSESLTTFGRTQILIVDHIIAGRTAELPNLLPDILYVTLLPFLGQEESMRQAQLASTN